ncbi:MAG: hypothetical protein J7604_17605 [Sporocytophaga sp.]|uniref:hypothetical protein n=1 Tax=Sporocytophaga sp. TaxID=2231183 RepID=UPI001AFE4BD8|nr:hypothetical protein [Sporocytophaga sp.]MBO9702028.1 hypothetical protein [Sporocytophaga sp.]
MLAADSRKRRLKRRIFYRNEGWNGSKRKTGDLTTIENGEQVAKATLPDLPEGTTPADAEATIHSHPTETQIKDGKFYPQTATQPSPTDRTTFSQYGTNFIVGRLGQATVTQNSNGSYNINQKDLGAVIYKGNAAPIMLTQKAIGRIIK